MQESISLYIDLAPGHRADLEVVARASLAYSAAIKEVAYVLDPSLEIRVEVISGTEGSLSLNSIIRSIKDRADRRTLKAIGLIVLGWFANDLRSYGVSEVLDSLLKPEVTVTLTQDDIDQIARQVSKALETHLAKRHVEVVFRELERDPAVKGVGATRTPGARPDNIIPRDRFRERGGLDNFTEETPRRRARCSQERVTLVSPVLLPGQRKWRFSFHEGEFGATIKDPEFLDSVLFGRSIPMAAGIQMDVLLETKEEFQGGVWIVKERNVLHVFGIDPTLKQGSLRFPSARQDQGDDDNDQQD